MLIAGPAILDCAGGFDAEATAPLLPVAGALTIVLAAATQRVWRTMEIECAFDVIGAAYATLLGDSVVCQSWHKYGYDMNRQQSGHERQRQSAGYCPECVTGPG